MKRLTFLLSISMIMLLLSTLPVWATNYIVRAHGTVGGEQITLNINGTQRAIWTLTTDDANYSATIPTVISGDCTINFTNHSGSNAVYIDYLSVNGVIRQAEDQAVNTGCSSPYSEWLYCNGYIDFGCVGNCKTLIVTPSAINLTAEANSTGIIDVNSDTTWSVSDLPAWLTANPMSDSNVGSVLLTAQANTSTSPRTATITFSGTNATSQYVTVTQDQNLCITPTWLTITPKVNRIRTINVSSSTSWTVSSDQNWLTVSPTSGTNNGIVTVTAQQNTDSSTRTGTVTFSADGQLQTVTVVQLDAAGDCVVPPMPPFSTLKSNPKFPDPFMFMDGHRMTSKSEWKCRRGEIAALVQEFELGYKQYTPYSATTGAMNGSTLVVTVTDGNTISFNAPITYPSVGSPPYPAIIGCGFSSLNNSALLSLGVAIINFPSDTIAQEVDASSRGKGLFYNIYGSDHSAGSLMAWAWGMDRLIDAIEKTPGCNIDPNRLGVTGCSRWGKGALICGAFDERIKLTIPEESGSGGAASWRVSDWQGTSVQGLCELVGENDWMRANFSQFCNYTGKLPFDHHMIEGLCAPRALLVIENSSMVWLGDVSTWTNNNVAHKIWQALGIPDKMGYSSVGNHDHCAFPSSQQPIVTAYVQKFLVGGGTADTNVMSIDGGEIYNESQWVDWTVPNLYLPGDFDNSGTVDLADLAILANAWLSDPNKPAWDGRTNISLPVDNIINFLDFNIFAENWLKVDVP